MFFFGIFGIESKEKGIRDINNVTCKSCGRMSVYKLIKVYSYFHIFFIPIFKWGTRYYLISRCCNNVYQISEDKGKALESCENSLIENGDLVSINEEKSSKDELMCKSCRRFISSDFQYCPYCGERIK